MFLFFGLPFLFLLRFILGLFGVDTGTLFYETPPDERTFFERMKDEGIPPPWLR